MLQLVAMAAVTFLLHVPENNQLANPRLTERAHALIDDSFKLLEASPAHSKDAKVKAAHAKKEDSA